MFERQNVLLISFISFDDILWESSLKTYTQIEMLGICRFKTDQFISRGGMMFFNNKLDVMSDYYNYYLQQQNKTHIRFHQPYGWLDHTYGLRHSEV